MKNKAIKNIVNSDSWQYVEEIFNEEILYKNVRIKTGGKSNEEIVRELVAREEAVKIVKKVLAKLKRIANIDLEGQSYK